MRLLATTSDTSEGKQCLYFSVTSRKKIPILEHTYQGRRQKINFNSHTQRREIYFLSLLWEQYTAPLDWIQDIDPEYVPGLSFTGKQILKEWLSFFSPGKLYLFYDWFRVFPTGKMEMLKEDRWLPTERLPKNAEEVDLFSDPPVDPIQIYPTAIYFRVKGK